VTGQHSPYMRQRCFPEAAAKIWRAVVWERSNLYEGVAVPAMIIDNSDVERINEGYLRASLAAMGNIDLCFRATDLLRAAAMLKSFTSDDEKTILRLGIRLINDAGACGTCAIAGYYQPAAAHIRDIIEVEFLLDLFMREPSEIARWRLCSEKERRRDFKASELRRRLDNLDGHSNKARDHAYSLFSQHATHVAPWKVQLIVSERTVGSGPVTRSRPLLWVRRLAHRSLG
jgi:hypothetical protein